MGLLTDYLDGLTERLDKLDGREVTVHETHVANDRVSHRGGSDRDIDDLAEKVAYALGKRMRREGLQ